MSATPEGTAVTAGMGVGGTAAMGFTSDTGVDDMGPVGRGLTGGGLVGMGPAVLEAAGGLGAGAALVTAGSLGAAGLPPPPPPNNTSSKWYMNLKSIQVNVC